MDVVALSQYGIQYATAALGTATTQDHMTMLMRGTQEIVCCYDGDRAGRDAAWRAVENALPALKDGVQLKFRCVKTPGTRPGRYGRTERPNQTAFRVNYSTHAGIYGSGADRCAYHIS